MGKTKNKIKPNEPVTFKKRRLNYVSNPDKPTKLALLIYEYSGQERIYHSVMISDEICVIDDHKILYSDTVESILPYFEPIQGNFLEKTGHQVGKINTLETKYKVIEEVSTFENYLTKKNKKIWNLIYAAYKYSHMVDLYFLNEEGAEKKDSFFKAWKSTF